MTAACLLCCGFAHAPAAQPLVRHPLQLRQQSLRGLLLSACHGLSCPGAQQDPRLVQAASQGCRKMHTRAARCHLPCRLPAGGCYNVAVSGRRMQTRPAPCAACRPGTGAPRTQVGAFGIPTVRARCCLHAVRHATETPVRFRRDVHRQASREALLWNPTHGLSHLRRIRPL